MSSLFNNDTDWRIGVIRYRAAYFLYVFHTETELSIEFGQTPIEKRMCYWGHKFEDYLCSGMVLFSFMEVFPQKKISKDNLSDYEHIFQQKTVDARSW